MCLMCDMTGRDHFHISPGEYRDFGPDDGSGPQGYRPSTQDTNTSVKTTLNFNSGNNIIVASEDGTTYRGLSGDDTYILSEETIKANAEIKLIDTEGKNTVQLVDGLKISESLFTSNATRLTLSNGAEITINGADKFTFELSANLTNGTLGISKTYAEFAEYMGIDSLPTRGSQSGNTNVTINELKPKTKTDLQTLLSGETRTVQSAEILEVEIDDYLTHPEIPDFSESVTDLSDLNDLSGLDTIVLYQDYEKATIAIRADKKGIKIFDTSFLNINQDHAQPQPGDLDNWGEWGLNYQYWSYLENADWLKDDEKAFFLYEETVSSNLLDVIKDIYDVDPNGIYLAPETYFGSDGEYYHNNMTFYQEWEPVVEDRRTDTISVQTKTFFGTENNPKIKIQWKDGKLDNGNDIWKTYIITIDSVFDDETEVASIQEKINSFNDLPPNTIEYEIRDNSYPFATRDQIKLAGSKLVIEGGENDADALLVTVNIRAYFKYGNGYTFENEEDNYQDITVTLNITDDDYVRTQSSKIIESTTNSTSVSIIEDNPGDILLDLKDFNIDPGSAKIKDVKINYFEKSTFETYLGEIFYIDEDVLKFSEGALYDYDSDKILFIHHIRNDANDDTKDAVGYSFLKTNLTSNIRDNDFEITFTYKSNDKDFEHTLKIVDYENTESGNFLTQDHVLTYETNITDNKYINSLNHITRFTHSNPEVDSLTLKEDEWNNYETIITYAFCNPAEDNIPIRSYSTFLDTCYFNPYDNIDTLWPTNDNAKNMVREILARTSEMFKITFKEVDSNNYDDAQIRFHWYESTGGKVSFAYYPSIDRTDIMVALNRPEQFDDPSYFEISPQGTMTWTTRHELGHALGLKHPFEHFVISGELDEALYPEYYYANTIFTNMAYAEFFSKNKDKYAEGNPKYASTAFSLVTKYDFKLNDQIQVSPDDPPGMTPMYSHPLRQPNWARDDILTLGYKYGLRENYNAGDNTYNWSADTNIYETLHDMGGNDTIDLSNYDWDMKIDLNPGAVSEVGINQERINFDGTPIKDIKKTGDVFILSWSTVIENYIGSDGSDDVTLNTSVVNTINTGAGDDVIRNVLATDIVNAGAGSDTVYISYTNLDPNITVSIDGGSETSDYDWIICDLAPNSEKDFTLCRTAFVNFEGYDFTDGEKQTITLDSDDFVTVNSQTLKIKGDSNDEISLPQDAVQTNSDDLYLYYTLNDVEIGISTDLMII